MKRPDLERRLRRARSYDECVTALVDQAGQPFELAQLEGDFALLFFGFTNCPDVCPLTLKVLGWYS